MPQHLLSDLITGLNCEQQQGPIAHGITQDIQSLACDPDQVIEGSLFIAMPRWHINAHRVIDGHDHINSAIQRGARAIVCQRLPTEQMEQVTYLLVSDCNRALISLAGAWFGHPSRALTLVGVTGTNGKTTIATSLYHLFRKLGHRTGLISTIENRIHNQTVTTTRTTPDILELHQLMRRMVDAGCSHCFMEVSSHGIDQNRIGGLAFDGAIFTNLGRDHLDYHPTFEHYAHTKKRFFDALGETAFALTNGDDPQGAFMTQDCLAQVHDYGLLHPARFHARILSHKLTGLRLDLQGQALACRMSGTFNAYNLLAVYAAATLLGESEGPVRDALEALEPVEGRLDWVQSQDGITGIVDYAHTPEALHAVLQAIHGIKPPQARVLTVLGCGGNRDQDKRPLMAAAAFEASHRLILTSDNPRYENPVDIVDDMKQGLSNSEAERTLTVLNRPQAIKTACRLADKGDVILVAGKGHERYQEINGTRHPCHDMGVLHDALGEF